MCMQLSVGPFFLNYQYIGFSFLVFCITFSSWFSAIAQAALQVLSPVDTFGIYNWHTWWWKHSQNKINGVCVFMILFFLSHFRDHAPWHWLKYSSLKVTKTFSRHLEFTVSRYVLCGIVVTSLDLRLRRSWVSGLTLSGNDFGQVVHTHVPLSASSIIWYWSGDGDVLWLGR